MKPHEIIQERFLKAMGMPIHKLVEWVVFGVSKSENTIMAIASMHYFTPFILSKFMSVTAVSEIMNISLQQCKADIGLANYHLSINEDKRLEIFQIIASINHEREILRLAA